MEAHGILGVPKDASEEQIRAAYKALALKWHPDRQLQNREQATIKFAEINKAHRTMLRTLARAERSRRTAKATQECPNSDPMPSSPPTSESLFASLEQPTRSSRSRKASPTNSCSPCPSSSHSSQSSRSSSQTRDTPCTSTSSINSAPISPSGPSINPESPAPRTDALCEKSNDQSDTYDSNPKTFHHRDSLVSDPDFMGDTLRPERSILRTGAPKKWVHVLNMTLEEIYQGKRFHFRLIRYELSGKKNIVPLNVTVPLGSRDGTKVIVSNIGNERKDGTRQDIVFLVKELKHKRFSRVRNDLLLDVRLPWVDGLNVKEGEIHVEGIDGKVYPFLVNFSNNGLLSGTTIIPNTGMHHPGGKERGRIIVRWEISSPQSSWDAIKDGLKPLIGR